MKRQKDAQLDIIKFQLSELESQLKKEQKEIVSKLEQRDITIASQQQEITKLRRENRKLTNRLKKIADENSENKSVIQYQTTTSCYSSSDLSDASVYGTIGKVSSQNNETTKISSIALDRASELSYEQNLVNQSKERMPSSIPIYEMSKSPTDLSHLSLRVKNNVNIPNKYVKALTSRHTDIDTSNISSVRAMADRVLHKPPIAEKPKVSSTNRGPTNTTSPKALNQPQSPNSSNQNPLGSAESNNSPKAKNEPGSHPGGRECTIVSTISRLLEEESEGGATTSSDSSGPPSPDASLSMLTPRVVRLARHYEGMYGAAYITQLK